MSIARLVSPLSSSFSPASVRRSFAAVHWLFLLPGLGLSLFAADAALPPHPTILTAEYQGKNLPVVGAEKNHPVVIVDGARKALPYTTPLTTDRAAHYLPAKATLTGGITKRYFVEKDNWSGSRAFDATKEQAMDVELSLTAEQDLTDCFLMAVAYELTPPETSDIRDRNYAAISVHEVGTLMAGVTKKIAYGEVAKFPVRYSDRPQPDAPPYTKMRYFWLLFSGGGEVRTDPPAAVSEFFYRRERLLHSLTLTAYLRQNKDKSQPVRPMMMIPPSLENTQGFPANASATLTVGADGTVIEAVLDQQFPADAATVIDTTLKAWLFMPEIKNGKPVPAKVRIPLQF